MSQPEEKGNLYIVSTPIGNLSDITLRALEILKNIEIIAAEDTRTTRKILNKYSITSPKLISCEEHSEEKRCGFLIEQLSDGKNIALLSEAGAPLISDPGYRLVKEAIRNNIRIIPIPGPSAVIAALSVSGCSTDKFSFLGYIPRSSSKREDFIESLKSYDHTIILFESPHRIMKTLDVLAEKLPDREIALCRELTKVHEEMLRGTPAEIIGLIPDEEKIKGEITLVVNKAARLRDERFIKIRTDEFYRILTEEVGVKPSRAAALTARLSGVSRNVIYNRFKKEK